MSLKVIENGVNQSNATYYGITGKTVSTHYKNGSRVRVISVIVDCLTWTSWDVVYATAYYASTDAALDTSGKQVTGTFVHANANSLDILYNLIVIVPPNYFYKIELTIVGAQAAGSVSYWNEMDIS